MPPHGAASAEAAIYQANCRMLQMLGVDVAAPTVRTWRGGPQSTWPAVVLSPDFAPCYRELRKKMTAPSKVRISSNSSLEVIGCNIQIGELDLDGALKIDVGPRVEL